jgi:hypothetical protein
MKKQSKVGFKTGIIGIKDELHFQKTIFRIAKGNCFVQYIRFDEIFQIEKDEELKLVFFVLYPLM